MGITSLDNAISGLRMSQQQLNVISNNIANAGNEGYTRKILPQSSVIIQNTGAGVRGDPIIRTVDLNLQRDMWSQISATDFYSVQESYLNRVQDFHGPPDSEFSITAEIGALRDGFAALADRPEDRFLQSEALDQAQDTATKIKDFATYITTLRNDTQNELISAVQEVNALLEQIAEMNGEVRFATQANRSSAEYADRRDVAIRDLAGYIDVETFQRGDGVIVVQTTGGVELASDFVAELNFAPGPISAVSSYPDSAAAITVGDVRDFGDPVDITSSALGGKIGGLLALRDEVFPKQQAQLDEFAHKVALRFDAQGLRLFTDQSGNIPADTPPDSANGTAVSYVGFSLSFQVNTAVENDPSLLQRGTYGATPQSGSSEVLRRIAEFTFGDIEYQQIINNDATTAVDLQAAATGATTLQDWLGLRADASVSGVADLAAYADIADIITAGGTDVFGPALGETDTFEIILDDPDYGTGPHVIEVDLRAVPDTGGNAAQDLIAFITADPDWANAVTDFNASVSVNANGTLQIDSNSNVQIAASATQGLSETGFAFLGLAPSTTEAEDPYFDVKIGSEDAVRISITPSDTEVELLAKLNAIEGVVAELSADGFLSVRPGNSFTDPDYGGDISITGGPFNTDGAALTGTLAGRTSIDDGVNIVSALFGSYNDLGGGVFQNISPVESIAYGSETDAGSGESVSFRVNNLGPNTGVSTEIFDASNLVDFAQKMINDHTQDLVSVQNRKSDEESLQNLLEQQYLDTSAVSIDEELGFLIQVQTAYSASARVVTAVDELFDELLNTFR